MTPEVETAIKSIASLALDISATNYLDQLKVRDAFDSVAGALIELNRLLELKANRPNRLGPSIIVHDNQEQRIQLSDILDPTNFNAAPQQFTD